MNEQEDEMKFFQIYRHASKEPRACKLGWSWPGFLFTGIWALTQRYYLLGLITLGGALAVFPARIPGYILWWILAAGYFGLEGNSLRRKKLMRNGYSHVATIGAVSMKEALEKFEKSAVQ